MFFSKICQENSRFIKTWQEYRVLYVEDQYTFFITSRSFLFRMRNISDISSTKIQNTGFTFNNFFRKSRIFLDNVVKYCRAGQTTDDNMALAHRKVGKCGYVHTPLKYVILIVFPLQQWLHERASMSRSTYIECLLNNKRYYVNF
jgi:hypothetical protein